ncbi:trypsin 5G1-like [Topomyia yanbarensis]|uniref:trypsin 5G1-like n=1 Tax=Topomyia yanbarensis TaxID=2498891 RepID=UPI00273C780A|nr:trypsin 5G1-like [Topomyia yanbarensis]
MARIGVYLVLCTYMVVSSGTQTLVHSRRPWLNFTSSCRIVGGSEIDISKVPFQVSMGYCGGSIISERWILSAAHCVHRVEDRRLQVRVGSSRRHTGGQLINVKRVLKHPEYNEDTTDYDFALLKLAKAVGLNEKFYAVELPEQDEPITEGTCLQVSGWGDTHNAEESHELLRATKVPLVSQEVCRKAYTSMITDRMLCAGYQEGGKDACQGDSGGPLVDGRKQIGVVSWGHGCARPGFPGVYARVAAVRNWIKKNSGV